jgi:AraC-like DNA-binding protein
LIESINCAIDQIETHLTDPIDIGQVAASVGYSRFHFDRLFLAMTGQTPAGYIRQRRLSEAARMLVTSPQPILEIALDYRFGSQEAFTRAFRRVFRLTPRAYRQRGHLKRYQSRISLKRCRIQRLDDGLYQQPALLLPPPTKLTLLFFWHL